MDLATQVICIGLHYANIHNHNGSNFMTYNANDFAKLSALEQPLPKPNLRLMLHLSEGSKDNLWFYCAEKLANSDSHSSDYLCSYWHFCSCTGFNLCCRIDFLQLAIRETVCKIANCVLKLPQQYMLDYFLLAGSSSNSNITLNTEASNHFKSISCCTSSTSFPKPVTCDFKDFWLVAPVYNCKVYIPVLSSCEIVVLILWGLVICCGAYLLFSIGKTMVLHSKRRGNPIQMSLRMVRRWRSASSKLNIPSTTGACSPSDQLPSKVDSEINVLNAASTSGTCGSLSSSLATADGSPTSSTRFETLEGIAQRNPNQSANQLPAFGESIKATNSRSSSSVMVGVGLRGCGDSSTIGSSVEQTSPLQRQRSVCHDDTTLEVWRSRCSNGSIVSGSNNAGIGVSHAGGHHIQYSHQPQYEISDDFRQKQVEAMERKYGGALRARRSAVVIQRAWRKYRLQKSFNKLRRSCHTSGLSIGSVAIHGGSRIGSTRIMNSSGNRYRQFSNSSNITNGYQIRHNYTIAQNSSSSNAQFISSSNTPVFKQPSTASGVHYEPPSTSSKGVNAVSAASFIATSPVVPRHATKSDVACSSSVLPAVSLSTHYERYPQPSAGPGPYVTGRHHGVARVTVIDDGTGSTRAVLKSSGAPIATVAPDANGRPKVYYQIADSAIFGNGSQHLPASASSTTTTTIDPNEITAVVRPPLVRAQPGTSSNRGSGGRSKSTERPSKHCHYHHNQQHLYTRQPLKILSDRSEVLGDPVGRPPGVPHAGYQQSTHGSGVPQSTRIRVPPPRFDSTSAMPATSSLMVGGGVDPNTYAPHLNLASSNNALSSDHRSNTGARPPNPPERTVSIPNAPGLINDVQIESAVATTINNSGKPLHHASQPPYKFSVPEINFSAASTGKGGHIAITNNCNSAPSSGVTSRNNSKQLQLDTPVADCVVSLAPNCAHSKPVLSDIPPSCDSTDIGSYQRPPVLGGTGLAVSPSLHPRSNLEYVGYRGPSPVWKHRHANTAPFDLNTSNQATMESPCISSSCHNPCLTGGSSFSGGVTSGADDNCALIVESVPNDNSMTREGISDFSPQGNLITALSKSLPERAFLASSTGAPLTTVPSGALAVDSGTGLSLCTTSPHSATHSTSSTAKGSSTHLHGCATDPGCSSYYDSPDGAVSAPVFSSATEGRVPQQFFGGYTRPTGVCGMPPAVGGPFSKRLSEADRKRQYRIALNFFNKKPDRGIELMMGFNFVEPNPQTVAKFLQERKGLSKHMIGEYLGNLQHPFNSAVLQCFVNDVDMTGLEVDMALRRFQSLFRLPGEAQKIERIVEVFAGRYAECNPAVVAQFQSADTVFILAFAIIMLNTDLHSPNVKAERKMKLDDFVKNLKGIDGGRDVDPSILAGIYNRVKESEFRPGSDHVSQVMKVDRTVIGKKPQLAVPHRRLVCYCRLFEVIDPHKKQGSNAHQREVFLFNDMILITKMLNKKKNNVTYSYRGSHSLVGMQVHPFKTQYYAHGIRITHTLENKNLFLNARQEDDRLKFLEDLKESIMESDEMEALRIEAALEHQQKWTSCLHSIPTFVPPPNKSNGVVGGGGSSRPGAVSRDHRVGAENRDSGLADIDAASTAAASSSSGEGGSISSSVELHGAGASTSASDSIPGDVSNPSGDVTGVPASTNIHSTSVAMRRGHVLSNSFLNLRDGGGNLDAALRQRRSSINSLDSGMSSTASTASRDSTAHEHAPPPNSSTGAHGLETPTTGTLVSGTRLPNHPISDQDTLTLPSRSGVKSAKHVSGLNSEPVTPEPLDVGAKIVGGVSGAISGLFSGGPKKKSSRSSGSVGEIRGIRRGSEQHLASVTGSPSGDATTQGTSNL